MILSGSQESQSFPGLCHFSLPVFPEPKHLEHFRGFSTAAEAFPLVDSAVLPVLSAPSPVGKGVARVLQSNSLGLKPGSIIY